MARDPRRGTVADYVRRDPGQIMPPPTNQAFRDGAARMGFRGLGGDWCSECDRLRHFCECPPCRPRKTPIGEALERLDREILSGRRRPPIARRDASPK